MKRIQYMIVRTSWAYELERLSAYGREGWDLAAVREDLTDSRKPIVLYLKKEVSNESG